MSEKIKHTKGSDNVFADLKVKNADEHDLKSTLGIMIIKLMREKNIKQTSAASLFGCQRALQTRPLVGTSK
jgi:predicted XRE-type DNA-binding protein